MARHSLTLKQRRFVAQYLHTGNGTQAALVAYDTKDAVTGAAIAAENLRKPQVQQAVAELLDANGLSDRKLAEIHAHYLALYQSDDSAEKALGLKALDMAYRLKGAYASAESDPAVDITEATIRAFQRRKAMLAQRAPVHPARREGDDPPNDT